MQLHVQLKSKENIFVLRNRQSLKLTQTYKHASPNLRIAYTDIYI